MPAAPPPTTTSRDFLPISATSFVGNCLKITARAAEVLPARPPGGRPAGKERAAVEEGRRGGEGSRRVREHLANERTFLSWVRTAIAILAFGFLVEKFSLYLRWVMGTAYFAVGGPSSEILAGVFVGLGGVLLVVAAVRFKVVQRQIDSGTFRPSPLADLLVVGVLLLMVVLLGLYLLRTG
ncbi:MAG: DUF202 domain-containing protein [Firmicutes bacterium]|nr:DUF202 domain-containing protein [Bacillota bacterium]